MSLEICEWLRIGKAEDRICGGRLRLTDFYFRTFILACGGMPPIEEEPAVAMFAPPTYYYC